MHKNKKKTLELLEKGEVVIDEKYSKFNDLNDKEISQIAYVGLIIIIIFVITPLFFLSILGFILIIYAFINFVTNLSSTYNLKGYAITSRKIILYSRNKQPTIYPYGKIYDVQSLTIITGTIRNNRVIRLFLEPEKENIFLSREYKDIESKKNLEPIFNQLKKHWLNNSPHLILNREINRFLKKHDLNTIQENNEKDIFFKRTINDIKIIANISRRAAPKELIIEIQCDNEENNYFFLREEKRVDIIRKNFGLQDIIIGDHWLDYNFIIQSNHESFLQNILDSPQIEMIKNSESEINYSIVFGTKQKTEDIKSSFDESGMLDQHLLNATNHRLRTKNHKSTLTLFSNNLDEIDDFNVLGKNIVRKLELALSLAKKINHYN